MFLNGIKMSRKYLNDRYCVRCSRKTVCPYLRKNYDKIINFFDNKKISVLDIGCGNGRNSNFMLGKGHEVVSLDMVSDYGQRCVLGQDSLPVNDSSVDFILCNYLMMFLDKNESSQVLSEMVRVSSKKCVVMVELYPAKDSYAKSEKEMLDMQKNIYSYFEKRGWSKYRYSKGRFIAKKL